MQPGLRLRARKAGSARVARMRTSVAEHIVILELSDRLHFNALTMEMANDMQVAGGWLVGDGALALGVVDFMYALGGRGVDLRRLVRPRSAHLLAPR